MQVFVIIGALVMRTKNTKSVVPAFALAGLILCTIGTAEQFGNFDELNLEISMRAAELLPFEPVPIAVALTNETANPINGHSIIEPGGGYLEIYVAKGEGAFEGFRTADWAHLDSIRGTEVLRPGFQQTAEGYLCYAHGRKFAEDPGQYLLGSPGTFRIKAVLKEREGERRVESNVLTVRAVEPAGEDAAAYELIETLRKKQDRGIYYGNFLLRSFGRNLSDEDQKQLDKKEEFLSMFPTSRYARYVEYSLGQTYSVSDDEQKRQRGTLLLERAAGYEDFFLAEEALRVLRRRARERGDEDKAEQYQVRMAKEFPNSPEGRDYMEKKYITARKLVGQPSELAGRGNARPRWAWAVIIGCGLVAVVLLLVGLVPMLKKKGISGGKQQ
jgi:hypothetical protein